MKIQVRTDSVDRDQFVINLVRKMRAKQIGAGKFGSVFATPTGSSVIKVCRDPAYRTFITYALKHQSNPWFPKIYSAVEHYPADELPYLVVEMERLRKGSDKEINGALCLFDNDRFTDVLMMAELLGLKDQIKMQYLREVRKVLVKLYKTFGPDFHRGNIMFRAKQAVVIDPIVDTNSLTTTEPVTAKYVSDQ